MNIIKKAVHEKMILLRKKQKLLQTLQTMPSGRICIHKNGTHYKWYRTNELSTEDKRQYIPKSDRQLALQLALKETLTSQLQYIEKQIDVLDSFIARYPSEEKWRPPRVLADKTIAVSLDLSAIKQLQPAEDWMSGSYEKSTEYPESLTVKTKAGIYVRSKSEKIIADELFDNNIPFRYEQALLLGDIKVFPDFTILVPGLTKHIVIWEHFGIMDSPSYAGNVKLKLGAYFDAAFIPGYNLIATFETRQNPLDSDYVSLLVGYHFT